MVEEADEPQPDSINPCNPYLFKCGICDFTMRTKYGFLRNDEIEYEGKIFYVYDPERLKQKLLRRDIQEEEKYGIEDEENGELHYTNAEGNSENSVGDQEKSCQNKSTNAVDDDFLVDDSFFSYVAVGYLCHICRRRVCIRDKCSIYYGNYFCTDCVSRYRKDFPSEVLQIVSVAKEKASEKERVEKERKEMEEEMLRKAAKKEK